MTIQKALICFLLICILTSGCTTIENSQSDEKIPECNNTITYDTFTISNCTPDGTGFFSGGHGLNQSSVSTCFNCTCERKTTSWDCGIDAHISDTDPELVLLS
jgi:hypothetical protein